VLVAIDHSAASGIVVDRCARLPLAHHGVVTLVHVMRWGLGATSPMAYVALERSALAALNQAAAQALRVAVAAGAPAPRLETELLAGRPFLEIIQRARARAVDLVVVGRHGHRTFLDALIGSTTERVLRKGTTPVLIVAQEPRGPYRRALVAVDASESCRRALDFALRVLPADASVEVVHAWGQPDDEPRARATITEFLAGYGPRAAGWSVLLREGEPRAVILGEARARNTDLLVLGTHGRSALHQMMVGSVAEAVARGARCDVLVARPGSHEYRSP